MLTLSQALASVSTFLWSPEEAVFSVADRKKNGRELFTCTHLIIRHISRWYRPSSLHGTIYLTLITVHELRTMGLLESSVVGEKKKDSFESWDDYWKMFRGSVVVLSSVVWLAYGMDRLDFLSRALEYERF